MTGVQTCALPICTGAWTERQLDTLGNTAVVHRWARSEADAGRHAAPNDAAPAPAVNVPRHDLSLAAGLRLCVPQLAHVHTRAAADHDSLLRADGEAADWTSTRSQLGPRHIARSHQPHKVVPLIELGHWELRRSLGRAAEDDPAQPPHARAFASWIQSAGTIREPLVSLARDAAAATGAMRQSVHVAVLGYAVTFDTSLWEAFSECVTWLAQRQHFVANRPPAFEVDGLALLGVAVGLSCDVAGTARQHRAWLASLLQRSIQSENAPGWNLSLRAAEIGRAHV